MVIVYESKTGFTKRYAEMLAKKLRVSIYSTSDIDLLKPGSTIVYLGWVREGKVVGIKKVLNKYKIKAICAVGAGKSAEPNEQEFISKNKIDGKKFFYLQGGYNPSKVKGFNKFIMYIFIRILKAKNTDSNLTETIENLEKGFDVVKEENLNPIFTYLNN